MVGPKDRTEKNTEVSSAQSQSHDDHEAVVTQCNRRKIAGHHEVSDDPSTRLSHANFPLQMTLDLLVPLRVELLSHQRRHLMCWARP